MGKDKRKRAEWSVFLRGSMTSLGLYLFGIFVVALFFVKGILPEGAMFPVVAGLCAAASLAGGMSVRGRTSLGRLYETMLNAVIFVSTLILAGMVCWREISWNGHGGILLVCALAGGALAGVSAKSNGRRKKRGKSRTVRK